MKDWWIEDEINAYLDAGFPAKGRLELHGGRCYASGIYAEGSGGKPEWWTRLSAHRTLRGAVRAKWRRLRHRDCICGCVVLVAPKRVGTRWHYERLNNGYWRA